MKVVGRLGNGFKSRRDANQPAEFFHFVHCFQKVFTRVFPLSTRAHAKVAILPDESPMMFLDHDHQCSGIICDPLDILVVRQHHAGDGITRAVKLPVPNLQCRELRCDRRDYRKKAEFQETLRVTTLGIQRPGRLAASSLLPKLKPQMNIPNR
jgi:two-component system, cell cycle response regulator DivK